MKAKSKNTNAFGFTLIEVLVALAILAISAMAISRQIAQGHHQQEKLELKTAALLVAENVAAEMMLADDWPALGSSTNTLNWGDLEWQVNQEVESTVEPLLRQITIAVALNNEPTELVSLIVFRGQY